MNQTEITALKQHADDRLKAHGTNAMLKVRATLCRDMAGALTGAQTQIAEAAAPPDDGEHAEIVRMREERDNATSAQATAEAELGMLRGVVEVVESGVKKATVMESVQAYRDDYPSAAGNTAERAGGDDANADDETSGDADSGGGE